MEKLPDAKQSSNGHNRVLSPEAPKRRGRPPKEVTHVTPSIPGGDTTSSPMPGQLGIPQTGVPDVPKAVETNTQIEGDDLFDPRNLRLGQDFAATIGVKKAVLTIPKRKPDKQWFWRVHPDPAYRVETAILQLKEDREVYLIDPALWSELSTEITPSLILFAINRQAVPFLLPITLPGSDGKWNAWHKSLYDAAELAEKKWVRASANMSLGGYDVWEASADLPEPVWPDLSFHQILKVAFKDNVIRTEGHPVIRKLRGEV
jgi:hypothetical protein